MLRNREIRLLCACAGAVGAAAVVICFAFDARAGLVCLLGIAACCGAFLVFTRWRYKKIAELSDAVRGLAERGAALDLREGAEGELSILQDEIHKLAARLSEQSVVLRGEKLALKDVLSDISHQLKTPLTAMSIMLDLLGAEDLPQEKRAEFMGKLKDSLFRMEWMVLSLLKLARLDADAVEFRPEPVSARRLVELAKKPLDILLDVRNQALHLEGGDASLLCDPLWTAEALTNVLKNASEYSPEGGVIRVSVGENPLCTWIAVADSGPGVDPADRPHLFRRFYRSKGAHESSVGIGLPLSLGILRAQNGDIEVRSERGQGSVFTLKLYRAT